MTNLLTDGGFETGVSGFSGPQSTVSRVTTGQRTGTGALQMVATAAGTRATNGVNTFCSPGDAFSCGGWVKWAAGASIKQVSVVVQFINASNAEVGVVVGTLVTPMSGDYAQVKCLAAVAPATTNRARMLIRINGAATNDTILFDDAEFNTGATLDSDAAVPDTPGPGAAVAPSGAAAGAGTAATAGTGAATAPAVDADGFGTAATTGSGAAAAPAGEAAGSSAAPGATTGAGAAHAPAGAATGTGTATATATGQAAAPAAQGDGSGTASTTGQGVATAPAGQIDGTGQASTTGAGAVTAPAGQADASGRVYNPDLSRDLTLTVLLEPPRLPADLAPGRLLAELEPNRLITRLEAAS